MEKIDRELTWVILRDGDRILMGIKKTGFGAGKLCGIGGKVEVGERVYDAAVREVEEEIGVRILEMELRAQIIYKDLYYKGAAENDKMYCYIATKWKGEPAESTEMQPEWQDLTALDYKRMWRDAELWMPAIFEDKLQVRACFYYNENNEFEKYDLELLPDVEIAASADETTDSLPDQRANHHVNGRKENEEK